MKFQEILFVLRKQQKSNFWFKKLSSLLIIFLYLDLKRHSYKSYILYITGQFWIIKKINAELFWVQF